MSIFIQLQPSQLLPNKNLHCFLYTTHEWYIMRFLLQIFF